MNVRRESDSFVVEEDGKLLGSPRRDTATSGKARRTNSSTSGIRLAPPAR